MRQRILSRLQHFLLVSACIVILMLACSKQKTAPKDNIQLMMSSFFHVSGKSSSAIDGIWIVEAASLAAMIEKKYLSSYVAKPDEMKSSQIRERLKSLNVFFRIEATSLSMLSIVSDSFGVSSGSLKLRTRASPAERIYDAMMQGRQGSTSKAVLRIHKVDGVERLEYRENDMVLTAVREKRPAAELISRFSQQITSGTGLAQY